jgi:hypothetical protein
MAIVNMHMDCFWSFLWNAEVSQQATTLFLKGNERLNRINHVDFVGDCGMENEFVALIVNTQSDCRNLLYSVQFAWQNTSFVSVTWLIVARTRKR